MFCVTDKILAYHIKPEISKNVKRKLIGYITKRKKYIDSYIEYLPFCSEMDLSGLHNCSTCFFIFNTYKPYIDTQHSSTNCTFFLIFLSAFIFLNYAAKIM